MPIQPMFIEPCPYGSGKWLLWKGGYYQDHFIPRNQLLGEFDSKVLAGNALAQALPPGVTPDPAEPTPGGLWYVVEHSDTTWTIQDRDGGAGKCIAQQYGKSSLANARLIASAPTMRAALQQIQKAYGALTAGLIAKRALGLELTRTEKEALDEYEEKAHA
jgi:hypothetical protein